jgi:hypothetical protein
MARLTVTAAAGASVGGLGALEEAIAVLTPALATLVADGASPTQAHVTAVNNAQTAVLAQLAPAFVVYYDRATINTPGKIQQAFAAALDQALRVS